MGILDEADRLAEEAAQNYKESREQKFINNRLALMHIFNVTYNCDCGALISTSSTEYMMDIECPRCHKKIHFHI